MVGALVAPGLDKAGAAIGANVAPEAASIANVVKEVVNQVLGSAAEQKTSSAVTPMPQSVCADKKSGSC